MKQNTNCSISHCRVHHHIDRVSWGHPQNVWQLLNVAPPDGGEVGVGGRYDVDLWWRVLTDLARPGPHVEDEESQDWRGDQREEQSNIHGLAPHTRVKLTGAITVNVIGVNWDTATLRDCDKETRWHCDTLTLWHFETVTLWLCDTVNLWLFDTNTLWPCDPVTLWHWDTETLWHCDTDLS